MIAEDKRGSATSNSFLAVLSRQNGQLPVPELVKFTWDGVQRQWSSESDNQIHKPFDAVEKVLNCFILPQNKALLVLSKRLLVFNYDSLDFEKEIHI